MHFIFSGSERHLVTEMFLSSARPFYNSTSILELYPIVAEEYIPFVCHWFDVYERTIREEDVLVIYRLFEGNTYSLVSSSAVQAAVRKLMELDLLTEEDNIYFIPDILFRMYLQRLKNTNIIFIPS